jgi:hypothetical protein
LELDRDPVAGKVGERVEFRKRWSGAANEKLAPGSGRLPRLAVRPEQRHGQIIGWSFAALESLARLPSRVSAGVDMSTHT